MEIPYFTMEKQKEFAVFLDKIRKIERSLDKEIACALEVFQTVSNLLLSGQEMPEKQEEMPVPVIETEDIHTEVPVKNISGEDEVSHIILAMLCGWSPLDERTGEYCRRRQEIFRKAQPFFQPVAISFVSGQGQKEYLLERDFLAYYSAAFCSMDQYPLDSLRDILLQKGNEKILDAHLAFQGETGICTEADWSPDMVKQMAKEGLLLLAEYSGLDACGFLFSY